jgi:aminopeptidase N
MLLLAALAILPLRYDLTLAPRDGGFEGSEQIELALAHSSVEVAQLGRSWFDRVGHPTLEVESRCHDGALEVRLQQGSHPIWPLPVRLETPATVLHLLLRHARQTLLLREPDGCPAWVTADGDQPYRVRYSSARR